MRYTVCILDGWVCEYSRAATLRWAQAGADMYSPQRARRAPFDLCDIPEEQFALAGHVWRWCRAALADPTQFGDGRGTLHGLGLWARNQLVRDLACLNRSAGRGSLGH